MAMLVDEYRTNIIGDFNKSRIAILGLLNENINKIEKDIIESEYLLKYSNSLNYVFKRYNEEIMEEISETIYKDFEKNLEKLKLYENEMCSKIEEKTELQIKSIADTFENNINLINEDALNNINTIIKEKADKMIDYYYEEGKIPYNEAEASKIKEFLTDTINTKINNYKNIIKEKSDVIKHKYFVNTVDNILEHKRTISAENKLEVKELKNDAILDNNYEPLKTQELIEEKQNKIDAQNKFNSDDIMNFTTIANTLGVNLIYDFKSNEITAKDRNNNDLNVKVLGDSLVLRDNEDNVYKIFYVDDSKKILCIDKNEKQNNVAYNVNNDYVYVINEDTHYSINLNNQDILRIERNDNYSQLDMNELINELNKANINISKIIRDHENARNNESGINRN